MNKQSRVHGKAVWVYIAGPYRGKTEQVVKSNIACARHAAVLLVKAGMFPVTPHLNTALFDFEPSLAEVPSNFWLDNYKDMVMNCDCVLVLDGYTKSEGTKEEIAVAQKYGIPVYFGLNELFDSIS